MLDIVQSQGNRGERVHRRGPEDTTRNTALPSKFEPRAALRQRDQALNGQGFDSRLCETRAAKIFVGHDKFHRVA